MNPKHKKHNSISIFLRRHASIVTFLGALIVFSTFVVKEGLREHLKDLSDSVSAARSRFESRKEINLIREQLSDIEHEVEYPKNEQPSLSNEVELESDNLDLAFASDDKDLSSIKELMDDIRATPKDYTNFEIWSDASEQRQDKFYDRWNDFVENDPNTNPEASDKSLLEIIRNAHSGSLPDYVDRQSFFEDMMKEAKDRQKGSERAYTICTWASYILYTVGWGLGLLGRLYKVDIAGDE